MNERPLTRFALTPREELALGLSKLWLLHSDSSEEQDDETAFYKRLVMHGWALALASAYAGDNGASMLERATADVAFEDGGRELIEDAQRGADASLWQKAARSTQAVVAPVVRLDSSTTDRRIIVLMELVSFFPWGGGKLFGFVDKQRNRDLNWLASALGSDSWGDIQDRLRHAAETLSREGSKLRPSPTQARVGGAAAGAILGAVAGGLAAGPVGGAVGAQMGLSGAAATSAGLALLGGGSLAAGGAGMAGGTALVISVGGAVGVAAGAVGGGAAGASSEREVSAAGSDAEPLRDVLDMDPGEVLADCAKLVVLDALVLRKDLNPANPDRS